MPTRTASNNSKLRLQCPVCGVKGCCETPDTQTPPPSCPMPLAPDLLAEAESAYLDQSKLHQLALQAARTEAAGYGRTTRIEDTMDFARRLGAYRLGIAHCVGLMREARLAREIFMGNGFEVQAVCCKVGAIDKEKLGLTDAEKVHPGNYESMCNPVAQAALLAAAGTQLNVVIGLCVGHDSLFFMHSQAPATVLIAKDRVLGHNPAASLYTCHTYYQRLKGPKT